MEAKGTFPDGVLPIKPKIFEDVRNRFLEGYQAESHATSSIRMIFVQDNLSASRWSVIRSLHFQHPHVQARLR